MFQKNYHLILTRESSVGVPVKKPEICIVYLVIFDFAGISTIYLLANGLNFKRKLPEFSHKANEIREQAFHHCFVNNPCILNRRASIRNI